MAANGEAATAVTKTTTVATKWRRPSYDCDHNDREETTKLKPAATATRQQWRADERPIKQLEQTVTKPQTVLALSPEQVATLPPDPPPTLRIRELE
ncbi:hypothetical protein EDB85DRAFT_2138352 [Lactarius pseudohatsudake]|nr:hypothetical protein EDB85DRAFT_2161173 [Lactarius pseudohatsudake]KAH9043636.1 hypothetical protein EDB85DRAFT_2138352 [Lactarius pseudohatsudake]